MAIKIMSKTKISDTKMAALEKQLVEIERELVNGIKGAIGMVMTLDSLHEIMDYCEDLSLNWDDRPPMDFNDDDLDSFDLPDDEED